MKYSSWDDYKWFVLGASLASSGVLWSGKGQSNKEIKASLNEDNSILSFSVSDKKGGDTSES